MNKEIKSSYRVGRKNILLAIPDEIYEAIERNRKTQNMTRTMYILKSILRDLHKEGF